MVSRTSTRRLSSLLPNNCGFTSIQMAKSYPDSSFVGFDFDASLIERARAMAASEGVSHNARFELADATDYPADDYDLIAFFSCLHDMGDPEGALSHAYESLKKRRGTLMIAEAPAGDRLEENFTPTGRILYCVSTMECVPASLDQDGIGLGTLMGESRLKDMVTSKGFTNFRRIAETPLLNVYEARVVS
ncbi:MAG: class I SAM-dependent methyltransferase [Thaumarchaeota archaeon]|nr:class I SAM-dependent methyltransferase [Nitrososphaerota archaeon]